MVGALEEILIYTMAMLCKEFLPRTTYKACSRTLVHQDLVADGKINEGGTVAIRCHTETQCCTLLAGEQSRRLREKLDLIREQVETVKCTGSEKADEVAGYGGQ